MNLFDKQIYHYITLILLVSGVYALADDAAMYTFGFLIIWVPGLVFYSKAALLAAGFNHIYIWVHYYTTELPDIRYIYGRHKN